MRHVGSTPGHVIDKICIPKEIMCASREVNPWSRDRSSEVKPESRDAIMRPQIPVP